MSMFKKAKREKSYVRIGLMGPPGSGKTYTGLKLLHYMGCKQIGVIDSERGSAKLYAGEQLSDGVVFDFDVAELEVFSVENYLEAIAGAKKAGFDGLVIDSLTHAWAGVGGLLEFVDKKSRASNSGNSYTAWRDATPKHNQLIDAILSYPGHVVGTLRTKMEYVLEEDSKGKKVPRKVGMAPIQREGLEYEFTIVGDFVEPERLAITKTRCSALAGGVFDKPGREIAEALMAWLNSAEGDLDKPAATPRDEDIQALRDAFEKTRQAYPHVEAEANDWFTSTQVSVTEKLAALRRIYSREHKAQMAKASEPAPSAPAPAPALASAPPPAPAAPSAAVEAALKSVLATYPSAGPEAEAIANSPLYGETEKLAELRKLWEHAREAARLAVVERSKAAAGATSAPAAPAPANTNAQKPDPKTAELRKRVARLVEAAKREGVDVGQTLSEFGPLDQVSAADLGALVSELEAVLNGRAA